MPYCTNQSILDLIPEVDLSAFGDQYALADTLTEIAGAASDDVDAMCRRTFVPPTQAAEKVFDGDGTSLMFVPDLLRLDSLSVNGTVQPGARAYPSSGPPYAWIATGYRFPAGAGNVHVTGLWGFGDAVPTTVARATACLGAAEVLSRLQAQRGQGASAQVMGLAREEYPDGGPWSERINDLRSTAGRLLVPYRRLMR